VKFIRDQEAVARRSSRRSPRRRSGRGAVADDPRGERARVQGRDRCGCRRDTIGAPSADEILVRPDGSFGFRVIDPKSGKKRGVFSYEDVRSAEKQEDKAERLRLYYVAMTRAIDRLIVSGAIDPERSQDRETPIGWVLGRLGAEHEIDSVASDPVSSDPVELERAMRASCSRSTAGRAGRRARAGVDHHGGRAARVFAELTTEPALRGYRLPELVPLRRRRCTRCGASRIASRALRALLRIGISRARRRAA